MKPSSSTVSRELETIIDAICVAAGVTRQELTSAANDTYRLRCLYGALACQTNATPDQICAALGLEPKPTSIHAWCDNYVLMSGDPAFRALDERVRGILNAGRYVGPAVPGIELRDYFAAAAMQGLLAANATYNGTTTKRGALARDAYAHADAMFAVRTAREKEESK